MHRFLCILRHIFLWQDMELEHHGEISLRGMVSCLNKLLQNKDFWNTYNKQFAGPFHIFHKRAIKVIWYGY